MLFITSQLFSQGHDTNAGNCVNYVPLPPLPNGASRVSPDGYIGCVVCVEAKRKKYEQEAKEAQERGKAYYANLERLRKEREAAEEKRKQDLERRNNTALAQLNSLKQDNVEFDRIRAKERARKDAINAKYDEEMGRENKAYQDHLSKLQNAATTELSASNDAFWNETVMAQNFIAFKDNKTGLAGFKDKNGKMIIQPQFYNALNYSGGITIVQYNSDKNYKMAILDARGETIKLFSKIEEDLQGQAEMKIEGSRFPSVVSDGIIFMPVSVRNPDYYNLIGLMNKEGRLITPKLFYKVEPFKNGMAKASRLINKNKIEFEEFPRDYYATFFYLEEGLIDKKGNWIQAPQKKLEYSYGSRAQGYLTIESEADRAMTKAERELQAERVARNEKIRHDAAMSKLESRVNSTVSSAKAGGYLIQNLNSKK